MSAPMRNLLLATLAFTIAFWAWNLVAPLGVHYAATLGLSPGQKSILVATPVLVGSVGRIAAGALADRFGGRVMFTSLLLASAPFVLLVAVAGNAASYLWLVVFAFFLGIAGTTFAVGIPFANAWFDAPRRGLATGVFGAGMGGTALSAYFTPRFVQWFGYTATHVVIAAALVLSAILVWLALRDAPGWRPDRDPVVPKLLGALRQPVTWQMSLLYAASFGGFVAFSTYLPTYLKDVYDFGLTDAGSRTAGFALAAVVMRPIGGALSDRVGPKVVTALSFVGAAVLAVLVALKPPLELAAGTEFVLLAAFMGLGTGAVFTWVARLAPADRVGSVSGLVGAAGGLGGFFPPLVMGATYDEANHSYAIGLSLLCVVAVVALAYTVFGIHERARSE